MALTRQQAYSLYVLLATDSATREDLLYTISEQQKLPRTFDSVDALRLALAGIVNKFDKTGGTDLSDENIGNMLPQPGRQPVFAAEVVRGSFGALTDYGTGPCPKLVEEQPLWDAVSLIAATTATSANA